MKFTKRTLPLTNLDLICLTWKTNNSSITKWNDECCPTSKIRKKLASQDCVASKCAPLSTDDTCSPTLKTTDVYPIWECRVPETKESCGGTNGELDPRCMPIIDGYDHPHVVMFDDYSYYVKIEFPEMY